MPDHNLLCDMHVTWDEENECFVAVAADPALEGIQGMGGSHSDAVADLELGMCIEVLLWKEEEKNRA